MWVWEKEFRKACVIIQDGNSKATTTRALGLLVARTKV